MEKLLPVQILEEPNENNGGLVKLPSGRKMIISKADAAALIPKPELCDEGDHPAGSNGDKCFACFVYNQEQKREQES